MDLACKPNFFSQIFRISKIFCFNRQHSTLYVTDYMSILRELPSRQTTVSKEQFVGIASG